MNARFSTSQFLAKAPIALALALALAPALANAASAASIRVETDAVEPLAGRDYSMRVDVAAARFERYDAASGRTELAQLDAGAAKAIAPGLWLAVPQGADRVALLPVGANPSAAATTVDVLALPAGIVAHIHDDGGVVWVDARDVRTASSTASNGAR